ncbi:MAG TPA: TIGR03086 family metal-binding protein [Acidimicrobiia bacterium]|nr:TIGR03086 family metal-binding protein [Acidimicrobiia bacterium]
MHDLRPAVRTLADLVAEVDDAQLGAPTPCPDYTVGDLLDHIGGLAVAFAAAARKEDGPNASVPPPGDRARLGDDWRTRIPRDLAALGDAWAAADAWDGTTKIAGMEMPASVVGTVGLDEVVTHGWDLARAIGRPFGADEATMAGCLEFLEPMSQPEAAAARAPAFGPVVEVPADAPTLDRLIGLTGRDPGWTR